MATPGAESAVCGCIVCDCLVVTICYTEQSGQLLVGLCYSEQLCVLDEVVGVTQLRDVVYVVTIRYEASGPSSTISRFNATTQQRLADLVIRGFSRFPNDIAACELTSQLYVVDHCECVWRVSSDGVDIQRWLPKSPSDTFKPWTLSVTSSRLLVTSHHTDKQLRQFDAAGGDELRRVNLPDYIFPWHAVESPTGTFIVDQWNAQLGPSEVSEVSTEGQVLRQFSSSSLCSPEHIAVDRHGNIFVADRGTHRGNVIELYPGNGRILLLDAQLSLRRVIIDARQLNNRSRSVSATRNSPDNCWSGFITIASSRCLMCFGDRHSA